MKPIHRTINDSILRLIGNKNIKYNLIISDMFQITVKKVQGGNLTANNIWMKHLSKLKWMSLKISIH